MRLPKGILQKLAYLSNINARTISDYAATSKRPGRQRSLELSKGCVALGLDIAPEVWLFGTSEDIKARLATKKNETA